MKKINEQGQSTIEFVLTLFLILAFILFYIQLSVFFMYGNLVHYGTFLSARAYSAASFDHGEQVERAKKLIIQLLKKNGDVGQERMPSIAKPVETGGDIPGAEIGGSSKYNFSPHDINYSWAEGVRYTFRGRIISIPLGSSSQGNWIELESESWLSREPSYQECESMMTSKGWLFDNGC